jgi:hypothetical protein
LEGGGGGGDFGCSLPCVLAPARLLEPGTFGAREGGTDTMEGFRQQGVDHEVCWKPGGGNMGKS